MHLCVRACIISNGVLSCEVTPSEVTSRRTGEVKSNEEVFTVVISGEVMTRRLVYVEVTSS